MSLIGAIDDATGKVPYALSGNRKTHKVISCCFRK